MNLMVDQSLGNLREKKNLICSSVDTDTQRTSRKLNQR